MVTIGPQLWCDPPPPPTGMHDTDLNNTSYQASNYLRMHTHTLSIIDSYTQRRHRPCTRRAHSDWHDSPPYGHDPVCQCRQISVFVGQTCRATSVPTIHALNGESYRPSEASDGDRNMSVCEIAAESVPISMMSPFAQEAQQYQ